MTSVNYSKIIGDTNSRMFNVADNFKDNSYEDNVDFCRTWQRPFSVGAINITGDLNIGMMIRSASLFGVENFYLFGRKKFDKRSTVGAEKYINIIQYTYDSPVEYETNELIAEQLRLLNHTVVLCEQDGHELEYKNEKFYQDIDVSPLFLFGSESHGIPQNIIDCGYRKLSIPQLGVLRSFNVSAAMNIICWDYVKENYL